MTHSIADRIIGTSEQRSVELNGIGYIFQVGFAIAYNEKNKVATAVSLILNEVNRDELGPTVQLETHQSEHYTEVYSALTLMDITITGLMDWLNNQTDDFLWHLGHHRTHGHRANPVIKRNHQPVQ